MFTPVGIERRFSVSKEHFLLLLRNRFWNAEKTSLIAFYLVPFVSLTPSPAIRSLAFSANGTQIAVGYENGYVEVYPSLFVDREEPFDGKSSLDEI